MSAGYDPFQWADIYADEAEYIRELMEEEKEREKENGRISKENGNPKFTDRGKKYKL